MYIEDTNAIDIYSFYTWFVGYNKVMNLIRLNFVIAYIAFNKDLVRF